MIDWTPDNYATSPLRRRASNGFYAGSPVKNSHWNPQYQDLQPQYWSQCPLKPSTSIWGSRINMMDTGAQVPNPADQSSFQSSGPQMIPAGYGTSYHRGSYGNNRWMSSAPSLSCSISSASSNGLWFDEPCLVSPPRSPEMSVIPETVPEDAKLSPVTKVSSRRSIGMSPPKAVGSPMASIQTSPDVSTTGSDIPDVSAVLTANVIATSPVCSDTFCIGTSPQEKLVISPSCGPLYIVQFKGARCDIFTAPGTASYAVGDAVMVDADRGRDLGVVTAANVSRHDAAAMKQQQHNDRQLALRNTPGASASPGSPDLSGSPQKDVPTVHSPKQILGAASRSEIKDLITKIEDEKCAVALCNRKTGERNLDMRIVDAEYQWDRRKLTFFYIADSRVDFRDLVRELFRIYKTRIWMCATTART